MNTNFYKKIHELLSEIEDRLIDYSQRAKRCAYDAELNHDLLQQYYNEEYDDIERLRESLKKTDEQLLTLNEWYGVNGSSYLAAMRDKSDIQTIEEAKLWLGLSPRPFQQPEDFHNDKEWKENEREIEEQMHTQEYIKEHCS